MDSRASDELLRFGGGANESTITPAAATIVVASIVLLCLLPRKYVLVLFLAVSVFIPYSQVILLGGLHFNVYRVLLPFAWARALISRSKDGRFRINRIDKAIIFWAIIQAICASLLWQSSGAIVNALGLLYNVFGTYFLFRLLLRDHEDVNRIIRTLAFVCTVPAVFMIWEARTGRNVFSLIGGVPELSAIREGRLRSQGPFAHPIVAGTVGATLLPLFVGVWWRESKSKVAAAVGVCAGVIMTLTSASATPLLALTAGLSALFLWPFRRQMRLFRWGLVLSLVGLQLVMNGPVWAIIKHVDVVGGASGYHRYELINEAIEHFGEWWLFGTKNPEGWGYEVGDVANGYLSVGFSGGFVTLLLFVAVLSKAFRALGSARRVAKSDRTLELQLWAFGASLLSNAVAFIGIWYFDQSVVIWYAFLGMICTMTSAASGVASGSEIRAEPGGQLVEETSGSH